ncbi:MAG: amidophosphoribosyltransferase, partial [Bacillota bacterium]
MRHEPEVGCVPNLLDDTPHEECGVIGIWAPGKPVSTLTYFGLIALQHRGQESAGIVVADGEDLVVRKGMGLVSDVFTTTDLEKLEGCGAIGHVRYSTTGASLLDNCQPVVVRYKGGALALAHNGNLVNAHELRVELEQDGSIFQSTIDSEVVAHLIARSHHRQLEAAVIESCQRVMGGYALVFITPQKLMAIRDPHGIRPL